MDRVTRPHLMKKRTKHAAALVAVLSGLVLVAGCGGGSDEGQRLDTSRAPEAGGTRGDRPPDLPPGHPEIAGTEAIDPASLPLKETGIGSLEELERSRAAAPNKEAGELFAGGFRLIFTTDQSQRDYRRARDLFQRALEIDANYAAAHRGLGYALFNIDFNVAGALEEYTKATEIRPDYGEAHYALAFIYALEDREKGADHFRRAMELGVEDERELGERFYPGVREEIPTH